VSHGRPHVDVVRAGRRAAIPLVVHVPHAGTAIPAEVRRTLVLDDAELAGVQLAMTDHHVDAIVAPLAALGATIVIGRVSRLVCDPERFPVDADEPMAVHGQGAVYTHTHDGRRLRPASWSAADRDAILRRFYEPHAATVAGAVAAVLDRFDACTILDAHSFPRWPLPHEDPALRRPHLCLGHDPFHVPRTWVAAWYDEARARGLTLLENEPFAGSYVPLRHWRRDARVRSLMVEFRRDLYLDERTGAPREGGLRRLQALTVAVARRLPRDQV